MADAEFFLRRNFMSQSPSLHVAIVMDGNGRWAARRGRPRTAGHRAGAEAVRRVVEAEIGRASCRERVEISVVAVSLKKKRYVKIMGTQQVGGLRKHSALSGRSIQ